MKAKDTTCNPNGNAMWPTPTMPPNSSQGAMPRNNDAQQPGPNKGNLVDTAPRKVQESVVSDADRRFNNN